MGAVASTIRRIRALLGWEQLGMSVEDVATGWSTPDWQQAMGLPAVWRAVSLLSADVAKVPIGVYRTRDDGTREELPQHQIVRLLKYEPNPGATAFTFRRTLTAHALLHGRGVAWIKRGAGRIRSLVVLDPEQTAPDEKGGRIVWQTKIEGAEVTLDDRDVFHLPGLSWDGLTGCSPLKVLRDALALELALQQHAAGFFQRGYALAGFVLSPQPLSPEEQENLRKQLRSLHSGAKRHHKVAVLSGGLDWKQWVADPQKSQLVETRQFGVREVANIFGLPPHKLGDPERTSYNSLEQENADYLASSLDPWLVAWEAECLRKLLSESERARGIYVEHKRNALLRTNYVDRVNGYRRLIEIGVLSPNEVRRLENLPPRQGGDQYYAPANWVPADHGGDRQGQASGKSPAQGAGGNGRPADHVVAVR